MPDAASTPVKLEYRPALGLRSAFMQSVLASKRPVRWLWRQRGLDLNARSSFHSFDTTDEAGEPVRLTGWHTPQAHAKSLVVMIHGWEGSHDSSYLYGLACALHAAGHAIFRLNLRDHGSTTHDLNRGMFHSARLKEVLDSIRAITQLDAAGENLQVIGFSLGGNFALRVGLHGPAAGVHPKLCIGISPAINPGSTLKAIDEGPAIIYRYFLDKWRKTMASKASAFPGQYDFSEQRQLRSFTEITRAFVASHTPYGSLDEYLSQYTLTPALLMASPTPLAILTAEDDSVCPPADFAGLSASGGMRHYLATPRGGHCGFIENWRMQSWGDRVIGRWLEAS